MKQLFFILSFLFGCIYSIAQEPSGYYSSAENKTGAELKTALYNIIKGHTTIGYSSLNNYYQQTDKKINGKVWDVYSDIPGGTPQYEYNFSQTCGNYNGEGDCWNKEHSLPQSWFNEASPMKSDMFHIYPTDGYVNGKRSNYPFGSVGSASWTSTNGSKLGNCSYPGYSGKVFEPIDEYKGDFARTYFYMATRYENVISNWSSPVLAGNSYPCFTAWTINMLIDWHLQDPVSEKEIARNNAIYAIQNNRNPYIDHPEWVKCVWQNICNTNLAFTSQPITTVTETNSYSYNIVASGPQGTSLTITCLTKPAWLSFVSNGGSANLSGTPALGQAGTYDVDLQVTDGVDIVHQSYIITVSSKPMALHFSSTPIITANEGVAYLYNIAASDIDYPADILTITCPTCPSWATFTSGVSGSAVLSGTPSASNLGVFSVQLIVSNQHNQTVNQTFNITVSPTGSSVGGMETFTNMPASNSSYTSRSWTGDEGHQWSSNNARTDLTINSRALCLKDNTSPLPYVLSGIISGGCSSISFTHQQKFSGSGGLFSVEVNGTIVAENIAVTADIQTTTINNISGVTGDFTIKFISNGLTRIAIDDVTWTGNGITNHPPQFTSVPITNAKHGVEYMYLITFSDDDSSDALSINVSEKPQWLSFIPDNMNHTAELSGSPSASDIGFHQVLLTVTDGIYTSNQSFIIEVTENNRPVFLSNPVLYGFAQTPYLYNIYVDDEDMDLVTISCLEKPSWLTFVTNADTATLSGIPLTTGLFNVDLLVSDGISVPTNQTFTINVSLTGISIKPTKNVEFYVYPNPIKTNSVIKLSNENRTSISFEIFTITGMKLFAYSDQIEGGIYNISKMDLNGYTPGIYILRVNIENDSFVNKIIIE